MRNNEAVAVKKRRMLVEPKPRGLRPFVINGGLISLAALRAELQDMTDVLMGREEPPVDPRRTDALLEVADAYFARASEITMEIQRAEAEGRISRGSPYVKFRTGELRTFCEIAKRAADVGSRRITSLQLRIESEKTGRQK